MPVDIVVPAKQINLPQKIESFFVKTMHISVLFCALGLKQGPFYQLAERDYGDALANLLSMD